MKLTPQEFEALRAWIRAEALHAVAEAKGHGYTNETEATAAREAAEALFVAGMVG